MCIRNCVWAYWELFLYTRHRQDPCRGIQRGVFGKTLKPSVCPLPLPSPAPPFTISQSILPSRTTNWGRARRRQRTRRNWEVCKVSLRAAFVLGLSTSLATCGSTRGKSRGKARPLIIPACFTLTWRVLTLALVSHRRSSVLDVGTRSTLFSDTLQAV